MQKIMFNDRYGLTQSVLDGHKIETRRELRGAPLLPTDTIEEVNLIGDEIQIIANGGESLIPIRPRYKLCETVAVAQSYKDAAVNPNENEFQIEFGSIKVSCYSPGYGNKMYTRADLMPHRIRITDIRIERLQDISDESCLREGIMRREMRTCPASECPNTIMYVAPNMPPKKTPREAFAALIDKVSGRGTWESNPYVVVYQFELVK